MQAQVVQAQVASNKYSEQNGVKQGCFLASILFSLYLGAMLVVAFTYVNEGVYIQTRYDANLLKIPHINAKTLTTRFLVREMLFADGSALVAHTAEDMQMLVDCFDSAVSHFSLKITIKKTSVHLLS